MDDNVNKFIERLDGYATRAEKADFGLWLGMYAYDNVGSVSFGKAFGFLEHSTDHGNYIAAGHKALPFLSIISMAPRYCQPILMALAAFVPSLLRAILCVDGIRKTAIREMEAAMARDRDTKQHHTLAQLLAIVEEKGGKAGITHREVTGEMWVAVVAGADSTGMLTSKNRATLPSSVQAVHIAESLTLHSCRSPRNLLPPPQASSCHGHSHHRDRHSLRERHTHTPRTTLPSYTSHLLDGSLQRSSTHMAYPPSHHAPVRTSTWSPATKRISHPQRLSNRHEPLHRPTQHRYFWRRRQRLSARAVVGS